MKSEIQTEKRIFVGKTAATTGIVFNLLLSLGKIIAGNLFGAVCVVADGVNNLADAASSCAMLFGFVLSEKPADKEHPYGHARFEHLSSLVVSILIFVVGFEFFKTSVIKIFRPAAIEATPVLFGVLIASILVKSALAVYFDARGKKISSQSLAAASIDSRNDAVMTTLILVCAVVEKIWNFRLDGFAGAALSVFIFWSGIGIAGKTISALLGRGADPALKEKMICKIKSAPEVIGCHDLMLHDYGPGKHFASIHVEMDKNTDPMLCHALIDQIERECKEEFGVHLVIHYDPVELDNPETVRLKNLVQALLSVRDARLLIHDFRLVSEEGESVLYFDLEFPSELLNQKDTIELNLKEALFKIEAKEYRLKITRDLES